MKEEENIGKVYMLKDGEMTCLGLNKDLFVPDEDGYYELDNDDRIIASTYDFNQYYIDKVSNGQPVRIIEYEGDSISNERGIYIATSSDDVYFLKYDARIIVFDDGDFDDCIYAKVRHLIDEYDHFTITDVLFEKLGNLNDGDVRLYFGSKSLQSRYFPFYEIKDFKLKDEIFQMVRHEKPVDKSHFELIYTLMNS